MNEQLKAQLMGLAHPSALLRRQATLGLFALLLKAPAQQQQAHDLLLACLTDPHLDVVEESVQQLVQAAASSGASPVTPVTALDLLLQALQGTTTAAPLLASGLVPLLKLLASTSSPPGTTHPLCAALLSAPSAGATLVTDTVNWLAAAAAAADDDTAGLDAAWRTLQPFFAFMLLAGATYDSSSGARGAAGLLQQQQASSEGALAAARGLLLSQLLGLAGCDAAAAGLVVPLVLQQLAVWRSDSAADRLALTQALSDVLDVLELYSSSSSDSAAIDSSWWAGACADAGRLLLLLAATGVSPAAAGGSSGGGGASAVLLLMWRLGGEICAGVWRSEVVTLGWLLMCVSSQQDQLILMKLMAAQLTAAPPQQQQQHLPGWQLAALQLPLLQQVVFATHKTAKRWAAAVLKHIRAQQQQQQALSGSSGGSSSCGAARAHCSQGGPLAPLAFVQQLLEHWEAKNPPQQQQQADVLDAVTWLHSFAAALQQQQQQQQSAAGPSTQPAALAAWCASQGVSPAVQLLLAALLQHQDDAVVSAAAPVLQLLLLRVPQLAPAFLPLVLQQLRLAYNTAAAGAAAAAGVQCGPAGRLVQQLLLLLLPSMCKDPSCAALVWRVLQPLMLAAQQQQQQRQQLPYLKQQQQGQTGGLLRAVGVQLCVSAWGQTGRGWGRAEAAVNGCISMSGVLGQDRGAAVRQQPLQLRLARAAAVRDVLASSSSRGLELLGCLQDSLADPHPAVAALALEGLDTLLGEDDLDFYKTWPLVARLLNPKRMLAAVGVQEGPLSPADLKGPPPSQSQQDGSSTHHPQQQQRQWHKLDGAAAAATALQHSSAGWCVARWVGCLRHGVLDAGSQPEMAAGVVQLLWLATGANEAQVRAAAYAALAEWPLATLTGLELLPAAGDYTSPLATEAAALAAALATAAAGGAATLPQQQQQQQSGVTAALAAHRSAIAAAEQLAAVAIRHEHENRRRFLALGRNARPAGSAAAAAAGDGSSGAAAAASAARDREAAALKHKLLHKLPKALLAEEVAGAAAAAPSVGVQLLLWQPAGSSAAAAAAAAAAGGAAYGRVFSDVAGRWGSSSSSLASPGFAAAAWQAFMHRWLVAAGRQPAFILSVLRPLWAGSGLPAAAAAALAAAAGLSAGGSLSEGQISGLLSDWLGLVTHHSRSSVVAAAALTALSRLLPALHLADWTNREAIVSTLHNTLLDCSPGSGSSSGSSVLAAAAAEAAGFVGVALLQQHTDGVTLGEGDRDRGLALACSCLGLLLSCLTAVFGSSSSSGGGGGDSSHVAAAVVDALPGSCRSLVMLEDLGLSTEVVQNPDLAAAVLKGCCCVLTALHKRTTPAAAPTAAAGVFAQFVLDALADLANSTTSSSSSRGGGSNGSAVAVGVAAAAPAAAAAALSAGILQPQQLAAVAAQLRQLACAGSSGTGADARTPSAAAVSWSQLVTLQLAAGQATTEGVQLVQWSTAVAAGGELGAAAAKAPAVLRCAAVTALGVLLGVNVSAGSSGESAAGLTAAAAAAAADGSRGGSSNGSSGVPGVPLRSLLPDVGQVKACLKVLEAAAVAAAGSTGSSAAAVAPWAAWLLAAVCIDAAAGRNAAGPSAVGGRGSGGVGTAAAGSGDAPSLSLYPAAGALRPLAERALALNPAAVLQGGANSLVAAVDAATCLRCLAAAPRLPAADWSSLCHKLLSLQQTPGTAAAAVTAQLQAACVELILGHCHVPGLELSGVLDACLSPEGVRGLPAQLQTLLLQRLDVALAALPANRAAPVLLQGVVPLVTAASSSSSSDASLLVVLSAWAGLARLASASAAAAPPFIAGSSQLTTAFHGCILQLLSLLPLLPAAAVTPALCHQVLGAAAADDDEEGNVVQQLTEQQLTSSCWLGAAEDSSSGVSKGGRDSQQQLLLVWKAALTCVRLLHPDVQQCLSESPSSPTLTGVVVEGAFARAVQLRGVLVLGGTFDWRALTDLRNTALRLLPAATAAAAGSSDAVLLSLALGGATAAQSGVLQQLQEISAAAHLAAAPVNAAVLIAAMLAAWLAAAGSTSSSGPGEEEAAAAAAEQQLAFGGGVAGLLQQLSSVLPQLVSCGALVGARQGFLSGVVAAVREVAAAVEEWDGEGAAGCVAQLRAAFHAVHRQG